ncbi:MAG: AraC family transcriptional regulator [Acidimicrobiales bacterium]
MDALVGLLEGARARGAFLLRTVMDPPWSMRIQDEAPLTLVAVFRGDAWVVPDGGEPVQLHPGDVAVVRGPDHYVIADDPATPPSVLIHPGQRCTTLRGDDLALTMDLGVRTWGNSLRGATVLLTGTYEGHSEVSQRMLDALPGLVVLRADDWDAPLVELLSRDIVKDDPGQEVVLDRLLDLLLIAVVRAWFSRHDTAAPAWWRADADPIVGRALRLLYNQPAEPWTIATLASAVGVSRASLARRFSDLVGEPPMSFLTSWRLALAADLLREPGSTIGAVAQRVGYGSPFALSTAFKRVYGVSPKQHRDAALAAG